MKVIFYNDELFEDLCIENSRENSKLKFINILMYGICNIYQIS